MQGSRFESSAAGLPMQSARSARPRIGPAPRRSACLWADARVASSAPVGRSAPPVAREISGGRNPMSLQRPRRAIQLAREAACRAWWTNNRPELDGPVTASLREGRRTRADSATPATAAERFSADAVRGGSVRGRVDASGSPGLGLTREKAAARLSRSRSCSRRLTCRRRSRSSSCSSLRSPSSRSRRFS
jgi:hypothetical protein